jgi:phospholipid transport system substrate-binding protein
MFIARSVRFGQTATSKERPVFRAFVHFTAVAVIGIAAPAAAAPDPAAVVGDFNAALVASMQSAKGTSLSSRTAKLTPLVTATHDMAGMTRLITGPVWATTSAADRDALIAAFTRHSVVTYAINFSGFDGEKFTVAPKVDMRGADALVHGAIVAKDGTTALNYRLRQTDGGWRIIDVFADGVSQIAVQRAEFAATVKAGGAAALAAKLNAADEAKLRK